MQHHAPTWLRLSRIPGVDWVAAEDLLAEIGPTAATFPSPEQFASWVGVCPGSRESAGISYRNRSAKGNGYLRRRLCQIAWAAVHTKDTFFQCLFVRLKPKIGSKGAAWAVAHRIAKVVWLLLHEGVQYQERGMRPSQLAKQHGQELAPTGETPRVPLGFVLLDGLLEIAARKQLQHLRKNAAYFVHRLSLLRLNWFLLEPNPAYQGLSLSPATTSSVSASS